MNDWTDIHSLADDELDAESRESVLCHLQEDPQARAEFAAIVAMKRRLADMESVDCEELWVSCRKRLSEMDRASRAERFVGKYSWALSAMLALVIGIAAFVNRSNPGDNVRSSDVASMVAGIAPSNTPTFDNPEDMSKWLRNETGAELALPGSLQARVVGYGQGWADGRRVVRFDLQDQVGMFALVAIEGCNGIAGTHPMVGSDLMASEINGANYVCWQESGRLIVLTGSRSSSELAEIAESLRRP